MNICKVRLTHFFVILLSLLFCFENVANDSKRFVSSVFKKKRRREIFLDCPPVDSDQNGTEEVYVLFRDFGDIYYRIYSETYNLKGRTLVFNDYLEPGQYKIEYNCF